MYRRTLRERGRRAPAKIYPRRITSKLEQQRNKPTLKQSVAPIPDDIHDGLVNVLEFDIKLIEFFCTGNK